MQSLSVKVLCDFEFLKILCSFKFFQVLCAFKFYMLSSFCVRYLKIVTLNWVRMRSNKPKLMSKRQLFCNSCYICLCGATLMACESWKVVFIV
jgi:hypothetical protein